MAEVAKKDMFIGECVFFSLAQQGAVAALAGMILDGGQILQCVAYAAGAYWIGMFVIVGRRADRLTRLDRLLVRWGFLMLCVVSFFLTRWIWSLRGY
ncbi:MAG: hypothetical protein QM813_06435 [Verrucomicrobiota bacterium]